MQLPLHLQETRKKTPNRDLSHHGCIAAVPIPGSSEKCILETLRAGLRCMLSAPLVQDYGDLAYEKAVDEYVRAESLWEEGGKWELPLKGRKPLGGGRKMGARR